ncbi:MAG: pentapeptide repeat-containing protein [Actinomycetes bacterium]
MDFSAEESDQVVWSGGGDTVESSKGSRHRRRRQHIAIGVFAVFVVVSAAVGVAIRVGKTSSAGTLVTAPSGASCDFQVSGDCQKMDLHGVVVRGVDLTGMKLNGSSLNGADFTGSTLTNTDLTDATFIGATLDGVKSGGVIGTKSLKTAFPSYLINPATYDYNYVYGFTTASEWLDTGQYGYFPNGDHFWDQFFVRDLRKEWLPPAWQLIGGYLVGPHANLAGAQFGSSDLSFQNLAYADLKGANLTNAFIDLVNVAGADMRGAAYPDKDWAQGKPYCWDHCWWNRVSNFAGAIVDYGSHITQPALWWWGIDWRYSQNNPSAPPQTASGACAKTFDLAGSTFIDCMSAPAPTTTTLPPTTTTTLPPTTTTTKRCGVVVWSGSSFKFVRC